jgi:Flp pilus assembly protein TadD
MPTRASDAAWSLLREGHGFYFADPPDYVAAEDRFRRATELAPDWGEPFHFLSAALKQQGRWNEACAAEQVALRLLPEDPRPLISLGWNLRLLGRYAEAVSLIERGLELNPHYGAAEARLMLAETYEQLGRIDKAAAEWRKVISMDIMYPSYERPIQEAQKKLADHDLRENDV